MLNSVPAQSAVRQPRSIVKVGVGGVNSGVVMPGWISWSVENNSFYAADTFRVTFAISMLPPQFDAAWWAQQTDIYIEIFAGFPANPENGGYESTDLTSLIYGKSDELTFDPVRRVIEIRGRDLTSTMIDTKTTEKWQNKTASQIATLLAARHGLTPAVTATKTVTGTYYQLDHVTMTDQRSEWDLLAYLANKEQFNVYIAGQTLHFEPVAAPSAEPFVLQWQPPTKDNASPVLNATEFSFSRTLTIAKGVAVVVRSWNMKNKKGFTVTWPSKGKGIQAGKASPFGGQQIYSFVLPNRSQQEALVFAQAKYKEITAHEYKLDASLPADNVLTTRTLIQVEGTGTPFDQTYYPDTITRDFSMDEGYIMRIHAKNHSPQSVVQP